MNEITHASLFSGIGAPELAAAWLGWKNVFHCEINPFCRKILKYWFPNSISYEDITTTDYRNWGGQIDVLTGGFPCQPFSHAGRRGGSDDDRYLWPQMLRAIREIQPLYVVGENVNGILSMVKPGNHVELGRSPALFNESDEVFYQAEQEYIVETICRDFEREGYSVQPIVIPACAVGAPHIRNRVWFIAKRGDAENALSVRREIRTVEEQGCDHLPRNPLATSFNGKVGLAPTDTIAHRRTAQQLHDGCTAQPQQEERREVQPRRTDCPQDWWRNFPTQPPVCCGNDGLPFDVDGLAIPFAQWRNKSIEAYGNSMVPQLVYEIFSAIQHDILTSNSK